MKKELTSIVLLLVISNLLAQAPKLYVHIVSHNEPTDNVNASLMVYNRYKNNTLQMANIVNAKNAKWNLQTSDGMVLGALQYESAGTSTTDVFERLANSQLVDSFVVLYIAFVLGPQHWSITLFLAVGTINFCYKVLAAIVMTPLLYFVHELIERYLGKDLATKMKADAAR